MEKIKKISLGLSFLLFLVPEILWSPLLNMGIAILKNSNTTVFWRPNFLTNPDNVNNLLVILFVQIIGVLVSIIFGFKIKMNFALKVALLSFLIILFIIICLIFAFVFALRHGIGF